MPGHFVTSLLAMLLLAGPAAGLPAGCNRSEGVELLLEAERPSAATDAAMETTREVVERRLAGLGAAGSVLRHGPRRILVTLARRDDAERVKRLIARPGRLEFMLLDEGAAPEQVEAGRAPVGSRILPYPDGGPGVRVAVRRPAIVSGRMVADANAMFDELGGPAVIVRFDAAGRRRFARATGDNVGKPLAIVIDNVVISAPVIREPISGGEAQISGSFTVESAEQLAIALRSGPLPIRLKVVEERVPAR